MGNELLIAQDLQKLFNDIDNRISKLEIDSRPSCEWYFSYPEFKFNGYKIIIFDDCYTWDYIEKVVTADGQVLKSYDDKNPLISTVLNNYYPKNPRDWGYDEDGNVLACVCHPKKEEIR